MNTSRRDLYKFSKHARSRYAQRCYRDEDIALVLRYGTPTDDGVLMTQKNVMEAMGDLRSQLQELGERSYQLKMAA